MKIKKITMVLSVVISALLCCNFAGYSFIEDENVQYTSESNPERISPLSYNTSYSSKGSSDSSSLKKISSNDDPQKEEPVSVIDITEPSLIESCQVVPVDTGDNESSCDSSCEENKEETIEEEKAQKPGFTIITDIIELDTYIYNQLGGSIYSSSGCGPTSAAMLLSSEIGMEISKDQAVADAYDQGFYYDAGINFTSGMGVTLENIQDLVSYYGQDSEIDHLWNNSSEDIIYTINEKLNEGHRLICGHRTFSGTLHYIVIYGKYCEKNCMYYKIVDPWGGTVYTWDQWTLSDRIMSVGGDDESTFEGCVKGLLWLK